MVTLRPGEGLLAEPDGMLYRRGGVGWSLASTGRNVLGRILNLGHAPGRGRELADAPLRGPGRARPRGRPGLPPDSDPAGARRQPGEWPLGWAMTQNNLGAVMQILRDRGKAVSRPAATEIGILAIENVLTGRPKPVRVRF